MPANKRSRTRAGGKQPAKPTYEQLEQRNAALESEVAQLQNEMAALKQRLEDAEGEDADAVADHGMDVEPTPTEEEAQGRHWKDLFASEVFWEHIAPKLGGTWTAMVSEACGEARSWPVPRGVKKKLSWSDTIRSVTMLRWCVRRGKSLTRSMAKAAAAQGNLDVLKCLHEDGCPWDAWTCRMAAEGGHFDMLKYAHENGCPWDEYTCECAAKGGHFDMLKYAHENGCPWDKETCEWAAWGGHLDMLKYARENGCPWGAKTCQNAAWQGHLQLVKYAHENGCPWDKKTCSSAAWNGHFDVLKYARENGCPWSAWTCLQAAEGGHLQVLQWAHANRCPWNEITCWKKAKKNGHNHVCEWIESTAPHSYFGYHHLDGPLSTDAT